MSATRFEALKPIRQGVKRLFDRFAAAIVPGLHRMVALRFSL
jgi:hypothetical protein